MNTDIDMTYRFLWDEEPADEQLQVIMQEVGEDVRRESEQLERLVKEKKQQAVEEVPGFAQSYGKFRKRMLTDQKAAKTTDSVQPGLHVRPSVTRSPIGLSGSDTFRCPPAMHKTRPCIV
jgi:hypothetical protein